MRTVEPRHRNPQHGGPVFLVPPLWTDRPGPVEPLVAADRAMLAGIATIVRFRKGETIYRQGEPATAVFNIVSGMAKSYKLLPDHSEHIVEFLFRHDLAGLAENGKYLNSADALTPVTLYRIPTIAAEARLRNHPSFDYQVICKLCHELGEAQRHAYLLSRNRAAVRLSLFLRMLASQQASHGESGDLFLPMNRSDIGAYAGISPEAVSRSFRQLTDQGVISFSDRRHVRILDAARLEQDAADQDLSSP